MKKQYTQPELEIRRLSMIEHIATASDNEIEPGGNGDLFGEPNS